nr:MAG TPA: hypothetical protein [Caudoviricetes sp.]
MCACSRPQGGMPPPPQGIDRKSVVRLRPAVRVPKRTISCAPPDRSPSKE